MKHPFGSPVLKIVLFVLTVILSWTVIAGAVGIYIMADENVYSDGGIQMQEDIYDALCRNEIQAVVSFLIENDALGSDELSERFAREFPRTQYNCMLTVTMEETGLSFLNFTLTDTLHTSTELYYRGTFAVTVTAGLRSDYISHDMLLKLAQRVLNWRYILPWITLALSLVVFALLCCLLMTAGKWNGHSEAHIIWFDHIPLDLLAGVLLIMIGYTMDSLGFIPAVLLAGIAELPLALGLLCSFVARCRAGVLGKTTCIGWGLRLLRRGILWVFGSFRGLSAIWKVGLAGGCMVFFHMLLALLLLESRSGFFIVLMVLADTVAALYLLRLGFGYRAIENVGALLARGSYTDPVRVSELPVTLRRHGADLSAIQDGVKLAVSREMKAERMKTELITNVSHDIKTPLTSIISYVDLLLKEDLPEPRVQEYLAVLDRQSKRLKKLTEDLVELSKASSGVLSVNLQPTDVNVFLSQLEGEYAERLSEAGLQLHTVPADSNPNIQADPALLYRVADNLMSNIRKYALAGTRVYLDAETFPERVVISFKNVSRDALNISPEELQERFVRGDNARSSEGSGLGLSIARSLTQLQLGSFQISIDGDLFRADLSFPLSP